jgi:hypothetical protein
MFKCLECGRKFKTARAAERAASNGCPGCGGVDIDLAGHMDDTPRRPGAVPDYDESTNPSNGEPCGQVFPDDFPELPF